MVFTPHFTPTPPSLPSLTARVDGHLANPALGGTLSPAVLDARKAEKPKLLRRLFQNVIKLAQPFDGARGMEGINVDLPLGSPLVPTDNLDMELFEVLRVPVLHGQLPEEHAPVLGVLRLVPGLNFDVARVLCTQDEAPAGMDAEGFKTLRAYVEGWGAGVGHCGITRRGLTEVTRALAPGEVGVLFGGQHFSTVFRYPRPTPRGRRSYLYRLVSEELHTKGVAWERLVVQQAVEGVPPTVQPLFCDYRACVAANRTNAYFTF